MLAIFIPNKYGNTFHVTIGNITADATWDATERAYIIKAALTERNFNVSADIQQV